MVQAVRAAYIGPIERLFPSEQLSHARIGIDLPASEPVDARSKILGARGHLIYSRDNAEPRLALFQQLFVSPQVRPGHAAATHHRQLDHLALLSFAHFYLHRLVCGLHTILKRKLRQSIRLTE